MSKPPARKSILASFGSFSNNPDNVPTDNEGANPRPLARVGAGVVGATHRSLAELREQRDRLQSILDTGATVELDPALVDPSPFPDRLSDDTDEPFRELVRLIEEEGQKVPIQVRVHARDPGRYQVVYGHRRWRAAKVLDRKVRAFVVELSDRDLVVSQGIENSHRQDLSWIERALFAARMDNAEIKARDIRAALGIDDPELARMRAVSRAIPSSLIEQIGRAPKVGRPRWTALASLVNTEPRSVEVMRETLSSDKVSRSSSDDRFASVLAAVKRPSKSERGIISLPIETRQVLGRVTVAGTDVALKVQKEHASAFAVFLESELPELVARYLAKDGHTDS